MSTFRSSSPIVTAGVETLVVHCSDFRFQAAYAEFFSKVLGLKGDYDPLVLPGGPQCLTLADYMPEFTLAITRWARYLIEMHKLNRAVLIAHHDCAWYRTLPFHIFNQDEPRKRQEEDLRRVRNIFIRKFPYFRVELFYANLDNSNHVTIEPVIG